MGTAVNRYHKGLAAAWIGIGEARAREHRKKAVRRLDLRQADGEEGYTRETL